MRPLFVQTLIAGTGGFIGASARYLVGGAVYRVLPTTFPYATLIINMTGCFGIGFLATLADEAFVIGPNGRLFLLIGVLGGYTTFSTFGYETFTLARDGSYLLVAGNVVGQVVLGLTGVWLGVAAARVVE